MKITAIETLHADAGWRNFSYIKMTTDEGIVGYSEYNESYGSRGVTGVIERLAPLVVGQDPMGVEPAFARLYAITRQAPNGINSQAIAAIENAMLDVKGKALGVPVSTLLGGAVRDRLRLYWSHCGTYRMNETTAGYLGKPTLKSLDDVAALGAEVRDRGFTALKCNIFLFDGQPRGHGPGFSGNLGAYQVPELNAERAVVRGAAMEMAAFREGAGPDMDLLLDLNFNFKTEGYIKMTRALEPYDMFWCELDMFNPEAMATIRSKAPMPIASCESLYGLREFRPYFLNQSMDVAIIDVPWNGAWQSYKIAAMADAHEVNVAPHNFYGHLCTMMSAQFCASLANFRIMEIDIDDVPWKDDLVTHPPEIVDGHLILPDRPGWGTDVNEEAVKAHPPKR
ncbi:MAG: mandelate racemase/muconate lactonizing enzyme family protein [Proteobacteria bacterium]|jgi:galactonate dehydratase|nr:mandelate racemase/muconate lactonizing enzyme family protein [Pseudomonadota bacterium]MDA1299545.1 mandelate racemase/muconate lactonizing enzyme family protein [Pseudomonadota bacterium]